LVNWWVEKHQRFLFNVFLFLSRFLRFFYFFLERFFLHLCENLMLTSLSKDTHISGKMFMNIRSAVSTLSNLLTDRQTPSEIYPSILGGSNIFNVIIKRPQLENDVKNSILLSVSSIMRQIICK